MPNTRGMVGFARALPRMVKFLSQKIDQATHLHFAIGGIAGDWAAVAALIAKSKDRPSTVWTDRVESQVAYFQAEQNTGLRRIKGRATAAAMALYEQLIIRNCGLGLFHGADCYDAYAKYSANPHLVHDIHLPKSARISANDLFIKMNTNDGSPLNIIYTGRAHLDKGVMEWIDTLDRARNKGVKFRATWYGDGPELERARAKVAELGLSDCVNFPGHSSDRDALMVAMRAADIFLFCHKTSESPRCLIEALVSGTPIVGYDRNYPADLIKNNGGGVLTPESPEALAVAVEQLYRDHERLSDLYLLASKDGYPHNDEDVFKHRSDLMKECA